MTTCKKDLEELQTKYKMLQSETARLIEKNEYLENELYSLQKENAKLKKGWDLERQTNALLIYTTIELRKKLSNELQDCLFKSTSDTKCL